MLVVSVFCFSWNYRPPMATFLVESRSGSVVVIRGFGGPVGPPCVVTITPRFVRITRVPRLLIPLLVKYLNVCRNEPRRFCGISLKGGSCSGYRPPLFGVVSLNSNSPLMRRVVSGLLPLSPQPFIRWQVCLVLWPKKTQETPVCRPIPA